MGIKRVLDGKKADENFPILVQLLSLFQARGILDSTISLFLFQMHVITCNRFFFHFLLPAIECGVPVVPGTPGPISTIEEAKEFVNEYGLQSMGGGGRGMRVVKSIDNLSDAFKLAQSETKSAFGDGTVFLERFLDNPRHISVQLLADKEGNMVYLFERGCGSCTRYESASEYGIIVARLMK